MKKSFHSHSWTKIVSNANGPSRRCWEPRRTSSQSTSRRHSSGPTRSKPDPSPEPARCLCFHREQDDRQRNIHSTPRSITAHREQDKGVDIMVFGFCICSCWVSVSQNVLEFVPNRFCRMFLYIEFARKLPHTGGELIYVKQLRQSWPICLCRDWSECSAQLDETLPTPPMFAYIIYTFYFVLTYNTASNSMQLANQALISANIHNNNYRPDGRLLRFLAIVALSFFCLLHYFSGRAGRTLNQILAGFKVCLLFIVFIAGIVRASKNFRGDWAQQSNSNGFAGSGPACARAFLLIIFAFSGWENATFVLYTVSCAAQSFWRNL
jgi:hypothetical protein